MGKEIRPDTVSSGKNKVEKTSKQTFFSVLDERKKSCMSGNQKLMELAALQRSMNIQSSSAVYYFEVFQFTNSFVCC
jgi:hypothetical protein